MSTWAQPGRLRRPGRGLKTEEKSANSQFSKTPLTQNFGHPRPPRGRPPQLSAALCPHSPLPPRPWNRGPCACADPRCVALVEIKDAVRAGQQVARAAWASSERGRQTLRIINSSILVSDRVPQHPDPVQPPHRSAFPRRQMEPLRPLRSTVYRKQAIK